MELLLLFVFVILYIVGYGFEGKVCGIIMIFNSYCEFFGSVYCVNLVSLLFKVFVFKVYLEWVWDEEILCMLI